MGGPCGKVGQGGAGAAARAAVPVPEPVDLVGVEESQMAASDTDVVFVYRWSGRSRVLQDRQTGARM